MVNISAAVVNNTLYTWENNGNGQLGQGNRTDLNTPKSVSGLPSGTITNLSLGEQHSVAVVNNKLYTWGYNNDGQLSISDNAIFKDLPQQVKSLIIFYSVDINLNSSNDRKNIRNKIIYDVTEADIRNLIDESRSAIGLQSSDIYTLNYINYDYCMFNQTKKGQITLRISTTYNVIDII